MTGAESVIITVARVRVCSIGDLLVRIAQSVGIGVSVGGGETVGDTRRIGRIGVGFDFVAIRCTVPVGVRLGGVGPARGLVPVAAAAPRELSTITFVLNAAPPLPFLAPEHHFKPAVIVMFVFDGDPEAGQTALEPFRRLATPLGELAAPMPYPAIYQFTAEGSKPGAGTIRSAFLDTLDDEAVDTILREMAAAPGHGMDFTQIRVLGGAVADVPADATAFAHRGATLMLSMQAAHGEDRAEADAWAARYFAAIAPKASGVYSNFLGDEGDARVRDAYPAGTYERLVDVKRRYDPSNLFRRNQNIRPR